MGMVVLAVLALLAGLALVLIGLRPGPAAVAPVTAGGQAWPTPAILVVDGSPLERTAWIAGRLAAEAIGIVAAGPQLMAMVGREAPDGGRTLVTLVTKQFEEGVKMGRRLMRDNPDRMVRAALAFDGYVTFRDGRRTDAVFIEARDYARTTPTHFTLVVPYRNASAPRGFAVYPPKFADVPPPQLDAVHNAFWAGVASLEPAATVWNDHIDRVR